MGVGSLVWLQQARPKPPSNRRLSRFQPGAFCVAGGGLPTLSVGCRVTVLPEGAGGGAAAEHGTLAKWDGAEDSEALHFNYDTLITTILELLASPGCAPPPLSLHPAGRPAHEEAAVLLDSHFGECTLLHSNYYTLTTITTVL